MEDPSIGDLAFVARANHLWRGYKSAANRKGGSPTVAPHLKPDAGAPKSHGAITRAPRLEETTMRTPFRWSLLVGCGLMAMAPSVQAQPDPAAAPAAAAPVEAAPPAPPPPEPPPPPPPAAAAPSMSPVPAA